MSNHAIEASISDAEYMVVQAEKPAQLPAVLPRPRNKRLLAAMHYVLTVVGVAALTVLGAMFVNPDFADRVMARSPFTTAEVDEAPEAYLSDAPAEPPLAGLMNSSANKIALLTSVPAAKVAHAMQATQTQAAQAPHVASQVTTTAGAAAAPLTAEERQTQGNARQQKLVTNWLAKRYRVAGDAADMLVSTAYATAREIKLDPLLILAVVAIESRFNPFAESPVGAQGLMQVMAKIHHEKFQDLGGIKAALNPVANIKVGSLILKEYVTRGGSVEAGLKTYVGAAQLESDNGYGHKVLSEYARLKEVAYGKRVAYFTTASAKPQAAPAKPAQSAEAAQAAVGGVHGADLAAI
jgi:soluble lytic murein transglycosylase-like protein